MKLNNIIKNGVLLFFITMSIYIITYIIYKNKNDLFIKFVNINSFIIIPLYSIYSLIFTFLISKKKKRNLILLESFCIPFLILFIGGMLSLIFIFLFFNFFDTNLLYKIKLGIINNWFKRYELDIINNYGIVKYKEKLLSISKGNIFNIWMFLICFFIFTMYYFIISVLIGLFFKNFKY